MGRTSARATLAGAQAREADTPEREQLSAWYATVLQAQGRTEEALKWAEHAAREAEAADDPEVARRCVHGDGMGLQRARQGRRRVR